ncbi:MAG: T9SS type A sorting domain-containing protein [Bacteroidota bacterium]
MKFTNLLLTLSLVFSTLAAQDTIKSLIISEARMDIRGLAYVEFTNMGEDPVNLSEFEFGRVSPWNSPEEFGDWYNLSANEWMMLPDVELPAGESYVLASVEDWIYSMHQQNPFKYNIFQSKQNIVRYADYHMHFQESDSLHPNDSVSEKALVMDVWNGRDCWYLRHHLSNGDEVVVDQVGGVFTDPDGTNPDAGFIDVAGIPGATGKTVLIRKHTVVEGNTDFFSGRGVDLIDSEWIPVPFLGENAPQRGSFWTVGNHGNYTLNQATLTSGTLDVDWDNKRITVPWGVRRDDSLMFRFDKREGLAWHYDYVARHEDSAFLSSRTGDVLHVYAVGNTLEHAEFKIQVAEPGVDANIVIPKKKKNFETGFYGAYSAGLYDAFCQVTDGHPGMDTIKHINGITGIPFATRVDSLFKYLEKAPKATWEIIWHNETSRADLENGDLLRVTAENGSVKDYYIKVNGYRSSNNALLGAITWPDIPEFLRDTPGWQGDTIPGFTPEKLTYRITFYPDIDNIPALDFKTLDPNASVEVIRATRWNGEVDDRTMHIVVTAESDTVTNEYTIELVKPKNPEDIEPFRADPFISQFVFRDQWANNFIEICNPGNQPLDLSNYMFFHGYVNNPEEAITTVPKDEWGILDYTLRYRKYIPGLKWQSETEWLAQPYLAVEDTKTDPVVQGGDVFVMTNLQTTGQSDPEEGPVQHYPARGEWDIDFANNPWGEDIAYDNVVEQWFGANFFVWKILNDSVKNGTKPATDPSDFELIETWGTGDSNRTQVISGTLLDQIQSYIRKPQYWLGHPEFGASYGDEESGEWTMTDMEYWSSQGYDWPQEILMVTDGIGQHQLNEITGYKSTVNSAIYKVSEGYGPDQQIEGIPPGITGTEFLDGIIVSDPGQTLTLISGTDGSILPVDNTLHNGDTLVVNSADEVNTTKYFLEVISDQVFDETLITSDIYTITLDAPGNGIIQGFTFDTYLSIIRENIVLPEGASLNIMDTENYPVPYQRVIGTDSIVHTMAGYNTIFEVIAENGISKTLYYLQPEQNEEEGFLVSHKYIVDQDNQIVSSLEVGTSVDALLNHTEVTPDWTHMVVDKYGMQRNNGSVALDDKIKLIDPSSQHHKYYRLDFDGYPVIDNDFMPVADAGPDRDVCVGEEVILLVNSDYTVNWSNAVVDGEPFFPEVTKDYIVTVENGFGMDTDTVTISVDSQCYHLNEYVTICEGDSMVFRETWYSTAGKHYDSLTTQGGNDSLYILNLSLSNNYFITDIQNICEGQIYAFNGNDYHTTGIYYDSLTTVHGCDSVFMLDLTVNPIDTVYTEEAICEGEEFFAEGAFQTEAGRYTDTYTSFQGCDSIVITNLTVHPVPEFSLGKDSTVYDSIILGVADEFEAYLWSTGESANSIVMDTSAGFNVHPVWLQVHNQHGCFASDTVLITFEEITSSMPHSENAFLEIFPNPSKGELNIKLNNGLEKMEVHLLSINGTLLMSKKLFPEDGMQGKMDISKFDNGMYILKVISGDAIQTKQIILNK